MASQKKIFTGGINSDAADEYLKLGVDRYRLNVRVLSSQDANEGAIENVKGNTLVTFALPAGTNKVIGAEQYLLKKKIYYFVYNSNNHHLILEYDQVTNTIAKVFEDSIAITGSSPNLLKFTSTGLITGIVIVKLNETSDLLYWNNPNSEPFKLNIQKGKFFVAGDYVNGYKFPFDSQILYRIKQPPLCPMTYDWILDAKSTAGSLVTAQGGTVNLYTGTDASTFYKVPFGVELTDTNNEYNPSTYTYTALSNGGRNVFANVRVFDNGNDTTTGTYGGYKQASSPEGHGYIYLYKNGVAIVSNSVDFTYYKKLSATFASNNEWAMIGAVNLSIQTSGLSLAIGDTLEVYVKVLATSNLSGVTNIGLPNVTGAVFYMGNNAGLTIQKPDTVNVPTNYLFKKLFRFKAQFVYDDYERSAWSPITKYVYPDTNTGGSEDIVAQDNIIRLFVPTGNSIVTKIRIAAQEVNSPDFVLIKEIDKSELNLGDNSIYIYEFDNQGNYAPLEITESNKLFDRVPISATSLALTSNNRLADGNITEGYDPVDIDVQLSLNYQWIEDVYAGKQNNHYPTTSYFKTGGVYEWGIIYLDHSNRSGLSNVYDYDSTTKIGGKYGSTLYMPFVNADNYNAPLTHWKLAWVTYPTMDISHLPPDWATHYQIVVSKNKGSGRYYQFPGDAIQYVDLTSGVVVAAAAADGVRVSLSTAVNYNYKYKSSIFYDYAVGDRIRFIGDNTGIVYDYNEQDVLNYDSLTNSILVRIGNNTPLTLQNGDLIEIYTPQSNATDLMYEIGECYEIGTNGIGKKYHKGNAQDQQIIAAQIVGASPTEIAIAYLGGYVINVGDVITLNNADGSIYRLTVTVFTLSFPFSVVQGSYEAIIPSTNFSGLLSQDTYVVSKTAKINITGGDTFKTAHVVPLSGGAGNVQYWMESDSASFFFYSKAWDFGRPNRIDKEYKQITRPSTIYYSEELIPETFINGLSSVFELNFETYNQNYGSIQKLYSDKQSLLMFQELKIGQIPVEQIIYTDLQNANTVGASQKVIRPQAIYYDGEYGIGIYPESFAVYGNVKYGVDVRRGVIWRLSTDGLTPISQLYGMSSFISNQFKGFAASASKVNIYGCYDVRFGEYIMATPSFTLAFNEKYNSFSTFYSYLPEMMCGNTVDIVSYKNGNLYIHNTNSAYNNFYGTFTPSEVWLMLNDNPVNVKVLEAVEVDCADKWEVYSITNPGGQLSNLIEDDFQTIENQQYAPVRRDENTPNVTFPLIEGDPMRDRTFLLKFRYNQQTYIKLFLVNLRYIMSNYHNVDGK